MEGKWLLIASALLVGLASADPNFTFQWNEEADRSLRIVDTPYTANRIVDVMVNVLVDFLARRGWNLNKSLQPVSGSVPFATNTGNQAMQVQISNGVYKNIGSIRRAKSATLNNSTHLLTGCFGFEGLEFVGNYRISTPAVGQAPAASASGSVSTTALKYFVDFSFIVDTQGLPVGIRGWMPRAGKMQYNGATNLSGSYQAIFNSVLKDGTRSLLGRFITNDLFNIVNSQIVGKMAIQA